MPGRISTEENAARCVPGGRQAARDLGTVPLAWARPTARLRRSLVRHRLRYAVNCSLLFTELPLLERPAAARAAGFSAIELWWPWPEPVPSAREVEALVAAIHEAGVRLLALNLYAG